MYVDAAFNHGFMVVGWGPLRECYNYYQSVDLSDPIWVNDYITNLSQMYDPTNFVPYVADFALDPGGIPTSQKWAQYPGPRPFYCILGYRYDPQAPPSIDFANNTRNLPYILSDSDNGAIHFYRVQLTINVPIERLYAPYFNCYADSLCKGEIP